LLILLIFFSCILLVFIFFTFYYLPHRVFFLELCTLLFVCVFRKTNILLLIIIPLFYFTLSICFLSKEFHSFNFNNFNTNLAFSPVIKAEQMLFNVDNDEY
jgi:hypothetical protein